MSAQVINRTENGFTVQITVPYNRSMLDFEETLQQQLNAAGVLATQEGLRQFDTDGSPITVGSIKLTSKGQLPKDYQTPYGMATVERHVYQSPQGGATYCPLDRDARIIVSSTPKFAKMVSSKYAEFGSARVQRDLRDNHGRDHLALPGSGRRRRGGRRGVGQGGSLELPLAQDGDAPGDRRAQLGWDLHVDVRGRLAGDDGGDDQLLRPRVVSDNTPSTWRRPPSMARRRSWVDWRPRCRM